MIQHIEFGFVARLGTWWWLQQQGLSTKVAKLVPVESLADGDERGSGRQRSTGNFSSATEERP